MDTDAFTSDKVEFWRQRYQENTTPWDLGGPAPPLVTLLHEKKEILKPGKMLVVGCGYGHDAAFFGRNGFQVIGVDYAPEAIRRAEQLYNREARFAQANLFNITPDTYGTFGYILEHTCYCAIRPNQREEYVNMIHLLLRPGGCFIGLFWAHKQHGGPPYSTSQEEITKRFSSRFRIESLETPSNWVADRAGEELLGIFYKRNLI